jgi:hypothetical protein
MKQQYAVSGGDACFRVETDTWISPVGPEQLLGCRFRVSFAWGGVWASSRIPKI